MIFEKLQWPILLILHSWKKSIQRHHRKSKSLGRSVSQRRMPLVNREASTHNDWWKANGWEQIPARKIKSDMKWWSLRILKGVLYIHSPNPDDELKNFALSRWSCEWWMFIFLSLEFFLDRVFSGFLTHVVATKVCTMGGVHTLTCRTHIFLSTWRAALSYIRTFSCVCTCTHGSNVMSKRCLHMCHLCSPSRLLPSHDLTCLCCSCTVTSRPLPTTTSLDDPHPQVLAVLSCLKSAGHAPSPHEDREVWLPIWLNGVVRVRPIRLRSMRLNTGCEPKEFDKITSVDCWHDASPTVRTTISPTSRKTTNENTGQFRCSHSV